MSILGDLLTGNEERTKEVLKAGALENFFWLLGNKCELILKETCWCLESITFDGKEEFVSLIVKNPIYMEKLILLMNSNYNKGTL